MLEYRRLFALLSSSIKQLRVSLKAGFPHACVHPHVDYRTATGRLVMSAPNLQGLPQSTASDAVHINLRSALVARTGHALVAVDYSQVPSFCSAHLCSHRNALCPAHAVVMRRLSFG